MNLYILRAITKETYDCPEGGVVDICERYEDIEFSNKREVLEAKADDLNQGHTCNAYGYWTERRANDLRQLHHSYDEHSVTHYVVADVSGQFTN